MVNQWTGFYIIGIPVMGELKILLRSKNLNSSHLKTKTYRDFHVDEILGRHISGKVFQFPKESGLQNWIVELL